MNKQRWSFSIVVLFLWCNAFPAWTEELGSHELLKKHYLSQFIEKNQGDTEYEPRSLDIDPDELKRYPLNERMTPLKTRTILLHYLCPECSGGKPRGKVLPLFYHTDVWRDIQVFQVPGKAHLYDAAFPGTTVMGEVYGAYTLVAGASRNLTLLETRQELIRQIQQRSLAEQFRESLKQMEENLNHGLAIFDRQHPFNTLSKANIFIEEEVVKEWMKNSEFSSAVSYLGGDAEVLGMNFKARFIHQNLDGSHADRMVKMSYLTAMMSTVVGPLEYWLSSGARSLELSPWQGCRDCVSNSLKLITKLGGYSQYIFFPLSIGQSIHQIYHDQRMYKNTRDVLIDELVSLKPFLNTLFSFSDIRNLPLINFNLNDNEKRILNVVLSKIEYLETVEDDYFLGSVSKAASALRWLRLLRSTIIRYLVNVSKLDFYISVAEGTRNTSLWSFVDYDENHWRQIEPTPKIAAKKLWNPLLPPEKAISSDLMLGGDHPANIVLTGANASGKSTFLRGLGINTIFLAQTLGVAAAKKFEFRPYTHFNSLMEKRDKNGRSSYETEVDNVLRVWEVNRKLTSHDHSMVLADELFRTTNAKEGASASKLLIRKLGNLPHLSLLVSTHFKSLNTMAVKYPERFANKHMSVEIDDETREITRMHYRLKDGISPSSNAIQMFDKKMRSQYPALYQD